MATDYPTRNPGETPGSYRDRIRAWQEAQTQTDDTTQPTNTTTPQSGGTTSPSSSTTTRDPSSESSQSAKALLESTLATYGLSALAGRVWEQYLNGIPIEQIMLDLRQTPEYKQRFPGMDALSQKGRAISEAQYIDLERSYVSLFRQAGLPEGFYDQASDFGAFIANEISPQEMAGRLDVARTALYETPPGVRDELARLYGLSTGDVMAFLLDANKALPIIERQFVAAQASYAANATGFGMLTVAEAERLGYTDRSFDEIVAGFDRLARSEELFTPILGEADRSTVGRQEQMDIVAGGNPAAIRRLEKRARERVAQFSGGGGYAGTREGVSGLGRADS